MNKNYKIILIIVTAFLITGCVSVEENKTTVINEEDQRYLNQIRVNVSQSAIVDSTQEEKENIIELSDNGSIYYVAKDGKRYIFASQDIYNTWFKGVEPYVSYNLEEIQIYPLGGSVGIKPGVLVITPTDYRLYVILPGERRAIISKELAKLIYGDDYESTILDVPNYYFVYYQPAPEIKQLSDFPLIDPTITIDENKGF